MSTVAVVDPRPIWSAGVAALVTLCGFELAGSWAKMGDALPALLEQQPDILILSCLSASDLAMGGLLDLKRRTAIVLIVERTEPFVPDGLPEEGIDALLASDATVESMCSCLSCVAGGHAWLDPGLVRALAKAGSAPDWRCLSTRELEVAHLAALGLSNKRIARALHVSDGTVKIHMHHIFSKLHVGGRSALVAGFHETDERGLGVHAPPLKRTVVLGE